MNLQRVPNNIQILRPLVQARHLAGGGEKYPGEDPTAADAAEG